jgi:hypothetical protein
MTQSKNARRTQAQWQSLVDAQAKSGQSAKRFCEVSVHPRPSLTHRYKSERMGFAANFSFHNLGVSAITLLAGCVSTRCRTSTR